MVRSGCLYKYSTSLFDFDHKAHDGEVVKVVTLPGTRGMNARVKHVEFTDGSIGFVLASTLSPATIAEKATYISAIESR